MFSYDIDLEAGYQRAYWENRTFQVFSTLTHPLDTNSWSEFLVYCTVCHIIFNPKAFGWLISNSISFLKKHKNMFNIYEIYKEKKMKNENKNTNTEKSLAKI